MGIIYRTINNIIKTIMFYRLYVVIHFYSLNNEFEEVIKAIPDKFETWEYQSNRYVLKPTFAVRIGRRAHFFVREGNAIPIHPLNSSATIQSKEVQIAIVNNIMDLLFAKKRDWILMVLAVFSIILTVVVIYDISQLQEIMNFIKTQQAIIETTVKK